jgi:type IV secretion system protein VirB7
MRQILVLGALALGLAGCATVAARAPSCDGYSRRPLNASMWEWERAKPVAVLGAAQGQPAAAFSEPTEPRVGVADPGSLPTVLAAYVGADRTPAIDIAGSLQRCG